MPQKIPRDTAVNLSQSDWILTLDADDYLEPDVIRKLTERQKQTAADMILLRMKFVNHDQTPMNISIPAQDFDFNQILTGKQAVMLTIEKWELGLNDALINKKLWTSKSSFLNKNNH